jgi:hypothetical protein
VWELLTCARQPYADVDADDMAEFLARGYRLGHPANCPFSMLVMFIILEY